MKSYGNRVKYPRQFAAFPKASMCSLNDSVFSVHLALRQNLTISSVEQKCTFADGYTQLLLIKTDMLLAELKAPAAGRDKQAPDGLSPTRSVSSVRIAGRSRCDAAPDCEGGTLFLRTAKCKWN